MDSLNRVLAQNPNPDTLRVNTLNALAKIYAVNDSATATQYATEALNLANQNGYIRGMAEAHAHLARAYRTVNNYPQAISYYMIARNLAGKANLLDVVAPINNQLGIIYKRQGNFEKALLHYEQSLTIHQQLKDSGRMAGVLNNMANVYTTQRRLDEAIKVYTQAIEIQEKIRDSTELSRLYNNVGVVYMDKTDYPKALLYFLDALKIRLQLQDSAHIATVYNNLGEIQQYQEDYAGALEYFQKALIIRERTGDQRGLARCYVNIGEMRKKQGALDEALEYFQFALLTHTEVNNREGMASSMIQMGDCHTDLGNILKAEEELNQALIIANELNNQKLEAQAMVVLGRAYFTVGNYEKAIELLDKGITLSNLVGIKQWVAIAAEHLSLSRANMGDYQAAYEAHRLFKRITDSIQAETNSEQLTRIQLEFSFKQERDSIEMEQTKEQLTHSEELKKEEAIQRWIGLILILSIAFGVAAFMLYRSNRRANMQLVESNEEIQSTNEEIRSVNESLQDSMEMVQRQWDEITDSILYAQRIQQAILPPKELLKSLLPDHFLLFRPRNVVSGDVYWVSDRRHINGKIFIAVVDCTGHGVPGAFMSLIANDLLNNLVNERQLQEPGEILDHLHQEIRQSLNQESTETQDGMDLALVAIDTEKKVLSYAGSYCPLVYIQDGEGKYIKGNSASIGGVRGLNTPPFTSHKLFYAGGLTFYIFSDGYQDQFGGPRNRKFMIRQFRELLFKIHDQPFDIQRTILNEKLEDWMGHEDQIDDILVLGARIE